MRIILKAENEASKEIETQKINYKKRQKYLNKKNS